MSTSAASTRLGRERKPTPSVRLVRLRMIHRLPGYDEAPWEIHSRGQYVREG